MATMSSLRRLVLAVLAVFNTFFLLILFPVFAIFLSGVGRVVSIIFNNKRIFETLDGVLIEFCERLIVFCCETLSTHEIVIHGNTKALDFLAERPSDQVVYISNHTAAADWIIAEFLSLRCRSLSRLRFVMKNSLRYFPLYGWFLRQRNCIFVKRGAREVESFKAQISRLGPGGVFRPGAWVVIFPEGTRIRNPATHPKLLASNREFASKHNLPVYEYLLTPRHRGLSLCIDGLTGQSLLSDIKQKGVSWLLDATVFYEPTGDKKNWVWDTSNSLTGAKRPRAVSIIGLLTGASRRIHIHLKLICLSENLANGDGQSFIVEKPPADEEIFVKWLGRLYSEKDALLARLFANISQSTLSPDDQAIRFGADVPHRTLPRPIKETLPHALFAFSFLLLFLVKAGIWTFLVLFMTESVLGLIVLFAFRDESMFF